MILCDTPLMGPQVLEDRRQQSAFLFRGRGREGVALFAVVEAENTRVTSRAFSSEARLSVASAALSRFAVVALKTWLPGHRCVELPQSRRPACGIFISHLSGLGPSMCRGAAASYPGPPVTPARL